MTPIAKHSRQDTPWSRWLRGLAIVGAAAVLAACGGGGDPAMPRQGAEEPPPPVEPAPTPETPIDPAPSPGETPPTPTPTPAAPPAPTAATRAEAFRLLTQATFGPVEPEVARVMSIGTAAWVNEQLAKPARAVHLARWNADTAALQTVDPAQTAAPRQVISSFYREALLADDQLRQRMTYALSQIFVVSLTELGDKRSQAVASYMDMLNANAFGNYRLLLERVTLHPAMGLYLSHMQNRKEDPATGHVPDQNYAREVMQLFSIGVVHLDAQGVPRLDADGRPLETYGPADIEALSRVFTGFSWAGPDTSLLRFRGSQAVPGGRNFTLPMQPYPAFHSTSEKRFLGRTVAAQSPANPAASLKAAMDTLAAHPNVGPFIGRQLIQRLVTSHPSKEYVGRVAAVFNDNGAGVRGDLKAVVKAILLDAEARSPTIAAGATYGKLREPVLRLTAYLRAFNARSDSGRYLLRATDDPGLELGQSPMKSPSVFNFYRPGFVPTSGNAAARGMTVPEMQITSENSVAGYANFMLDVVGRGIGLRGVDGRALRPDVQVDISGELAVAANAAALVDRVVARLIGENVNPSLKTEMRIAVESITVPVLNAARTNQPLIDKAKRTRVQIAQSMALLSPEFIVQK